MLSKNAKEWSNVYALLAISLWSTLAVLGLKLSHIPPFLLTGLALLIGGLIALPMAWKSQTLSAQHWKLPLSTLALGVYGLFGFHLLLFLALRLAPPVQANLINYLWPLLIVVLAPMFLSDVKLNATYLIAACAGFMGAFVAISSTKMAQNGLNAAFLSGLDSKTALGYACALGSAFIWSTYSLMSKRLSSRGQALSTEAIGLFSAVSGLLALLCHFALEPSVFISGRDWVLIVVTGLGPLGASFYLWDAALQKGDARQIGVLSYITPIASTALLLIFTGQPLTWGIALAAGLIVLACILSLGAKR